MVSLLSLAQGRVPLHQVGREWHGPCPFCGTSQRDPRQADRFWVNTESERCFCRQCNPKGWDAVAFLRQLDGLSCPDVYAALGKTCNFTDCAVREKCSQGKDGSGSPRKKQPSAPIEAPAFVPDVVKSPLDLWQERAEKLIDEAHAALLQSPEQLAYLAGRGLPLAAVIRYRLGFIEKDIYRSRPSWGLEEEYWEGGKPKHLKIHRGILIPTFVDNQPHRLRVRRDKRELKPGEITYIEVKGSGNDRVILNPAAKAVIVIESDLDALMIDWLAGDIVGAMPVVSAQSKPKESTWAILQRALVVLVSLDFEPRENVTTGKAENPGGQSARWWLKTLPRAKRWPTPLGKDPGEFFTDHGGDIRRWILAGLPPVFHVAQTQGAHAGAPLPEQTTTAAGRGGPICPPALDPAPPYHATITRGRAALGRLYVVADDHRDIPRLIADYPDHAVFHRAEMLHYQGMSAEELDTMIMIRQQCPGSETVATIAPGPDPSAGHRSTVGRGGPTCPPALNPSPALDHGTAHQSELAL